MTLRCELYAVIIRLRRRFAHLVSYKLSIRTWGHAAQQLSRDTYCKRKSEKTGSRFGPPYKSSSYKVRQMKLRQEHKIDLASRSYSSLVTQLRNWVRESWSQFVPFRFGSKEMFASASYIFPRYRELTWGPRIAHVCSMAVYPISIWYKLANTLAEECYATLNSVHSHISTWCYPIGSSRSVLHTDFDHDNGLGHVSSSGSYTRAASYNLR
jgi:hypothetical protein